MSIDHPGPDLAISDRDRQRTCATMLVHARMLRRSSEYRENRRRVEADTVNYTRRYGRAGLRTAVVTIPVVVHVVYNTPAQNISNVQIQSQIDVLNEDFRRLNVDAALVPSAFAPVAADSRIQFALARRDPTCNPTDGITRTSTNTALFTSDNAVKFTASGGRDAWPADKYLNIWVCPLFTLGYAQFPGGLIATDGVVIAYDAFGRTGTAAAPFHRGRTATHEIGHWLNLLHIWGDDGGGCDGSDNVADTPNQAGENHGCPMFPHVSCNNGPNGDMFMNYMDYTDDACMYMFTAGQSTRMDAALFTTRASILASAALIKPTPTADLWSQDVNDDDGTEPDTSTQPMWLSNDIWVRRKNDGVLNQDHQNPEYRTPGAAANYVYVRVRNRACAATASGTVKLYWAKASTALSWPSPWDGSVTTPALMGGSIGAQPVTVAGGDDEILIFPWEPPNPADYASFGADRSHFCLLSRIETSPTPPYGMSVPEGSNLYANVQNNNNIVWKNITVVDEVADRQPSAAVSIGNLDEGVIEAALSVTAVDEGRGTVFDVGDIVVDLGEELFGIWREQGARGEGFKIVDDGLLLVREGNAIINSLLLRPQIFYTVDLRFRLDEDRRMLGTEVYTVDLVQVVEDRAVGGQRFIFKTRADDKTATPDNAPRRFDGVEWASLDD